MDKRPSVFVLANNGEQINQQRNLERSAVYLLLMQDKVARDWGNRRVPPPALHDKRIQIGIGLVGPDGLERNDSAEANQHYLALKADTDHFHNPLEKHTACHELTAAGRQWAEELLAEAQAGRKPWLLDWRT